MSWMCRLAVLSLLLAVPAVAQPPPGVVAVIASKGQFKGPTDREGMEALAKVAHQRGYPVTWLLKPAAATEMADTLKQWQKGFGDEVAWFAEYPVPGAEAELKALKKAVTGQPIRSAGQTRFGADWVRLAANEGISGVWGRCFEQTYADNIVDRGSPFGFYYLRPDCYKVPATNDGGLVSVPWMSSDINLVFRTGWASGFTFDPDDPLAIGVIRAGDIRYWEALVDQTIAQAAYNAFVPLVIQQEYSAVGDSLRRKDGEDLAVLGDLFDLLKKRGIPVVTMSEAVRRYQQANPKRTPPTYALYDNLGSVGLAAAPQAHPRTGRLHTLQVVTEPLTKANAGKPFNGFFATDFSEGIRRYVHPEGKTYGQHGKLFAYYDVHGLLMFDEGVSKPVRITSYLALPANAHTPMVLPEMSHWYRTQDAIPEPTIDRAETATGLTITIKAAWTPAGRFTHARLPYGVMLWGDFARYRLPPQAPAGAKILGTHGLFIPVVLQSGDNQVSLSLTRVR